jgi:pimeloyl-ACP methyl ester carboxylesterase
MSQPEIPLSEACVPPRASGRADGTSYNVYGCGHPLVLIHGVGMRKAVWAPQIAELSARYRVVTYDMWGHGGSDLPPAGVELGAYAEQLAGLLRHLDMDEAHIVGHSMGALVALEFALGQPRRTSSLAALNAVYERSAVQSAAVRRRAAQLGRGDASANLDATMERWFGSPVDSAMRGAAAEIRRFLCEADLMGYARTYELFARADRAHSSRLAGLQCRALFMTGELDENSLPEMSRRMAAAAPHGRAEVVPGARHMMTVTAAAEVNRRLASFLECPQVAGAA